MKRNNKKGFTLAELLIVVAIIAVLVAIAIPVFNSQLNKAKLATDTANVRAYLAETIVESMDATSDSSITITQTSLQAVATKGSTVAVDNSAHTITVSLGSLTPNVITVDPDITLS